MDATEKQRSDQERAMNRRKQVLDAAAGCFSRSGFHGASMAQISKAAGMSAGHIYNYFDSKDAIIAAFVEMNVERVSDMMQDLAQREDPLQAMLDDTPQSVHDSIDPNTWHLPLEIFSEASRNPEVAAVVRDADLRSRSQLREVLKSSRLKRELPVGDDLIDGRVETIIALFQGLHLRILHNPELKEKDVVDGVKLALAPLLFS